MPHSYDQEASSFDRHRSLPVNALQAIRATIIRSLDVRRPHLLDLGAGTGRIGRSFVAAGDNYVGVDLSLGMLREFVQRSRIDGHCPRLVQADGQCLPFRAAAFDGVMLMQVIGAAQNWQLLIQEARRVLRPTGALILGHTMMPVDGIDAQMKRRLAALLGAAGGDSYHVDTRGVAQSWLGSLANNGARLVAAEWTAERTARGFLDRQRTGARFLALQPQVQEAALHKLAAWATETFGSLDAAFPEQHAFELQIARFPPRTLSDR
jgi:SAM-dependent methyltransferase